MPTATAKSLQSCLTLCDHIDGSPPGSPVPGILQARTLQCMKVKSQSCPTDPQRPHGLQPSRLLRGVPLPSPSPTPWTPAIPIPCGSQGCRELRGSHIHSGTTPVIERHCSDERFPCGPARGQRGREGLSVSSRMASPTQSLTSRYLFPQPGGKAAVMRFGRQNSLACSCPVS